MPGMTQTQATDTLFIRGENARRWIAIYGGRLESFETVQVHHEDGTIETLAMGGVFVQISQQQAASNVAPETYGLTYNWSASLWEERI
jgi:hypothetical protein